MNLLSRSVECLRCHLPPTAARRNEEGYGSGRVPGDWTAFTGFGLTAERMAAERHISDRVHLERGNVVIDRPSDER